MNKILTSFLINNIKASFVCYTKQELTSSDIVKLFKLKKGIIIKQYNNFCVLKNGYATYTIFPKRGDKKIHINITGLKELHSIKTATEKISELFSTLITFKKDYVIDNISASCSFKINCDLDRFHKDYSDTIKFNNERFPAFFYKTNNGTAIIFMNGNLNLVGCKSVSQLTDFRNSLNNIFMNYIK